MDPIAGLDNMDSSLSVGSSSRQDFAESLDYTSDHHTADSERGFKRRRLEADQTYIGCINPQDIESIDLTNAECSTALSNALSKQRKDAVKAQEIQSNAKETILAGYKCPVCMDVAENITTTICGRIQPFFLCQTEY